MVLEWLEGMSLSAELKDRRLRKAPPPSLAEVDEDVRARGARDRLRARAGRGAPRREAREPFLAEYTRRPRMKVLDFGMAKVLQPQTMGGLESAETLGRRDRALAAVRHARTTRQGDRRDRPVDRRLRVRARSCVEALTNRRARDAETFVALMTQIAKPAPLRRRDGGAPT